MRCLSIQHNLTRLLEAWLMSLTGEEDSEHNMIQERRLRSWGEFKREVARIRDQYGYHEVEIPEGIELAKGVTLADNRVLQRRNTVLFRGQNDASWPLQTTLERKTNLRPIHLAQYLVDVDCCVNEIESFTGRSWNFPNYQEWEKELRDLNDVFRVHLPAYNCLVYLRHHGFPSPLLDWSASPYIAAFFAFLERPRTDEVAILTYIEDSDGGRSLSGGAPMISVQGPYVTTHQRHFVQKTCYTVATRWDPEEERHYFCPHEDVLRQANPGQDILLKIILPSGARKEALRELLLDYNITPFTLFQTEDALIRTMELRRFDLEE